jgi:hypothetical protein
VRKGLLNHPDVQPSAAINCWIAAIKLFSFTLRHVPATLHKGPDGLLQRPATAEDISAEQEANDWIDEVYGFYTANPSATPSQHLREAVSISDSSYPWPPSTYSLVEGIDAADGPVSEDEAATLPQPSSSALSGVTIQRNQKASAADECTTLVEIYLRDPLVPLPLAPESLKGFLCYGPPFLATVKWLCEKYGVHQISISSWNSRANGVIEHPHYDV